MTSTDKDIFQKTKAIRYCISNGLLPYLEVIVNNVQELTDTKTVITDLDVVGVEVSRRGELNRVLFDCKTTSKLSPINRAFWAAGIMSYSGCDESYVILKKKASEAHKASAKILDVHLFREDDFDMYAESANINYLDFLPYTANIDNWHNYHQVFQKYSNLQVLGEFLNTKVPLSKDHTKTLRELIGLVRSIKGELDPAKADHMAVYASIILSFMLIMVPISSQIADIYDKALSQPEYEKLLRYFIWGGRESYLHRRDLKNAVLEATGMQKAELELPGWSGFVNISRLFLEAPSEIRKSLIPLKEISLRYVSTSADDKDQLLARKLEDSNRIKQFVIASSNYLVNSTGLPADFNQNFRDELEKIAP